PDGNRADTVRRWFPERRGPLHVLNAFGCRRVQRVGLILTFSNGEKRSATSSVSFSTPPSRSPQAWASTPLGPFRTPNRSRAAMPRRRSSQTSAIDRQRQVPPNGERCAARVTARPASPTTDGSIGVPRRVSGGP